MGTLSCLGGPSSTPIQPERSFELATGGREKSTARKNGGGRKTCPMAIHVLQGKQGHCPFCTGSLDSGSGSSIAGQRAVVPGRRPFSKYGLDESKIRRTKVPRSQCHKWKRRYQSEYQEVPSPQVQAKENSDTCFSRGSAYT